MSYSYPFSNQLGLLSFRKLGSSGHDSSHCTNESAPLSAVDEPKHAAALRQAAFPHGFDEIISFGTSEGLKESKSPIP